MFWCPPTIAIGQGGWYNKKQSIYKLEFREFVREARASNNIVI